MHPFYEMYVHMDGDISFMVNGRLYPLEKGNIIFTAPNTTHHCVCHQACIHEHYVAFFYTADATLLQLFDRLAEKVHLHFSPEKAQKWTELLLRMDRLVRSPITDSISSLSVFFQLIEMLGHTNHPIASSNYPDNFQEIIQYTQNHFSDIKSIRELADRFYISQSTLGRMFQRYLQVKPLQYLEAIKLSGACRSLCEGKSVTEAALTNGFSDTSYFITRFRNYFHMTPNQYKMKLHIRA